MFQAQTDGEAVAPRGQTPDVHFQHVLVRASVRNATRRDAVLKALALSVKPKDVRQALELLRAIADSIPFNALFVTA